MGERDDITPIDIATNAIIPRRSPGEDLPVTASNSSGKMRLSNEIQR